MSRGWKDAPTAANRLLGRTPRQPHKAGTIKVGIGRVGPGKGVAVERGPQRCGPHLVDDRKVANVEVHPRLHPQLTLRPRNGQACGHGSICSGADESAGVCEHEEEGEGQRKQQI